MKREKQSVPVASTSKIIDHVASKFSNLSKKNTTDLIKNFLNTIENHLASGEKVRVDKVGILLVKDRAARKGRNPQTNEEIVLPAGKKVSFTASQTLKKKIKK